MEEEISTVFLRKKIGNWVLFLGVVALALMFFVERFSTKTEVASAGTNISPVFQTDPPYNDLGATSTYWGWNGLMGWIDFHNTQTVNVTAQKITGYASSGLGEVSFDCGTTPVGNICQQTKNPPMWPEGYFVANDGGNLSGYGWNDVLGWIYFGPALAPYLGYLQSNPPNKPPSDFYGHAWNGIVGEISLCGGNGVANCLEVGGDQADWFKVRTSWYAGSVTGTLDSVVFDTGVAGGAQFNSILWKGIEPTGTDVRFQLATSNCENGAQNPPDCNSGNWEFVGSDGTGDSFYDGGTRDGANFLVQIDNSLAHFNKRYFRYRVWIISDSTQKFTPRIDDIIVNWSP